jgi:hypothetical protein
MNGLMVHEKGSVILYVGVVYILEFSISEPQ